MPCPITGHVLGMVLCASSADAPVYPPRYGADEPRLSIEYLIKRLNVGLHCSRHQEDYESPNVLLAVWHKARPLDLLAVSINKVHQPPRLANLSRATLEQHSSLCLK